MKSCIHLPTWTEKKGNLCSFQVWHWNEHKIQYHSASFLPTCQPCHLERTELTPSELPLLTKHLETMLASWYPFFPECQGMIQRQERGQVVLKCAHSHSWHTSSIPIYLKECIHFLEILHNKSISQIQATFPFLLPLIAYALRAINQRIWSVTGQPTNSFQVAEGWCTRTGILAGYA